MKETSSKKANIIKCVIAIALVLGIFLLVFFLYDSPAYYVKTPDGSVYIDRNNQPIFYYKDLFGRTFYNENGKRDYAAVPDSIEQVTPAGTQDTAQSAPDGETTTGN